jgi:hypothetical protein
MAKKPQTTIERINAFRKVASSDMEFYAVAKDLLPSLKIEHTMALENNLTDLEKQLKTLIDELQSSKYKVIK